jgi:hypothetical protein
MIVFGHFFYGALICFKVIRFVHGTTNKRDVKFCNGQIFTNQIVPWLQLFALWARADDRERRGRSGNFGVLSLWPSEAGTPVKSARDLRNTDDNLASGVIG